MGETQLVSSHKATLEEKGAPLQGQETGGGEEFSLKALNAGDWAGLPYAKADKPTEWVMVWDIGAQRWSPAQGHTASDRQRPNPQLRVDKIPAVETTPHRLPAAEEGWTLCQILPAAHSLDF